MLYSLDEALRACRLPIRVEYDLYDHDRRAAWWIIETPAGGSPIYYWETRCTHIDDFRKEYTALRQRLLAEQKEKNCEAD